jgi:trans-aconitate methyltransferase
LTSIQPHAPSNQTWTAEGYERNARFVSDLGAKILSWLNPQPGERILDLGCGDGALTMGIAAAGADVVGIDSSENMLEAARSRGLDARLMDACALTFSSEFDAVFSNAALHWMTQPVEVIEGVRRALKPRGRFVAEFGGHGNLASIVTAMRAAALAFGGDQATAQRSGFYPTPGEYRSLLETAGFSVSRIELSPRPTPLPRGVENWLLTFRGPFFDQFGSRRAEVIAYVVELLRPSLCDAAGQWTADYMRLRVSASLGQ